MSHPNLFLQMEIDFKHTLRDKDAEGFREYLVNKKSALYQYLTCINPSGKTALKIVFEVVRRPEFLNVFLDEGYGISLFRLILTETLRSDNVEAMKVLFGYKPYHSRLNQRAALLGFNYGYYLEDFVDLLTHCGLSLAKFLLDHEWMNSQLTVNRFIEISPRLTEDKIRLILRHQKFRRFLYAIESPYEWVNTLQRGLYGSSFNPVQETKKQYEHIQKIYIEERKIKTQNNWRFLFFCILLGFRAKEFRERFWAPGGSKSLQLQESFYKDLEGLKN